MEHSDLSNPQKASARRRLIRGAFSAPALMTVCTGSAFAQASNLRCLANAANHTGTPPAAWGITTTNVGGDSFLRARLWKVTTRTCTTATPPVCTDRATFYVKGSDLSGYSGGASILSNTQYLEINPGTYVTAASPVNPPGAPTVIVGTPGYVNQYVAVRFNASGMLVGVGPGNTGGMVGMSCWTSAFPRP